MPSSSSLRAMSSLSSTEKETDSPCVPSRRVVSKVNIFMAWLPKIDERGPEAHATLRYSRFFAFLQERHHFAQLFADLFDRLVGRGLAHGEELLASGLVFVDPLAGELAGLDL